MILLPAAVDALGNPKVLVLIDERVGEQIREQSSDEIFLHSAAEREIAKVFTEAGFNVVDPSWDAASGYIDLDVARAMTDEGKLREVADMFDADVIVTGQAYALSFTIFKPSVFTKVYYVRSRVKLQAILTNSASQVESGAVEERLRGVSVEDSAVSSIRLSAFKTGNSLLYQVTRALITEREGKTLGRSREDSPEEIVS
jgi:hypothetical protein